MVRVFLFILFLLPSFFYSYPAPCYGTKLPEKGNFFGGGQTHIILERHLEAEFGELRSTQHFFQFSYGFFDWLALDLKGGAGNIKQHPQGSDEIAYTSSFAGGYGLRLKLYDKEKVRAVLGFQHISVHPASVRLNGIKNQAILDDWQVSLLASYDFSKFTPYLGTKWSRVDYIHWIEDNRKRRMSDLTESIGLVFGFDIGLTPNTWLNLEGQFIDGQALSSSFNFKF
jgi:hypothetical protein